MKLKVLSIVNKLNISKCKEAANQAFFEQETEPQGTTDLSYKRSVNAEKLNLFEKKTTL